MKLRWYQVDAVKALYEHLEEREDNPCIVMPTGAGKSPTIGQIAHDVVKWDGRALILAHRKELLEQNAEKIWRFDKNLDVGIYSAGLRRRDTANRIIVAGIQSVYTKAKQLGSFNIVMVDEAHLIPEEGEGMYRTLLEGLKEINPGVRFIGFTATPFRTKGGAICKPENILNHVCYEAPLNALIVQGFLTKLVSYAGAEDGKIDTVDVQMRGGEFVQGQIEMKATVEGKVAAAVADIIERTKDRKKVLIFCCGVKHCEKVALEFAYQQKAKVGHVTGGTDREERDFLVEAFRLGELKYLANVSVFTEGLDVPDIDCIVMLRPTASPGLYVQMVGRGFRVAEGKENCLVLDYGGNVLRHGPIDLVKIREKKGGGGGDGTVPAKECPGCQALIYASCATCPQCGHEFPKEDVAKHTVKPYGKDLMATNRKPEWWDVMDTSYSVHKKWGAPDNHPRTVRVEYHVGFRSSFSEYLCVEHEGFARTKAMKWWGRRQKLGKKIPLPQSAEEAADILARGEMREAGRILVAEAKRRGDFDRVLDVELYMNDGKTLASKLQAQIAGVDDEDEDDDVEVPF